MAPITANSTAPSMAALLWSPSPTRIRQSNLQTLMDVIAKDGHRVGNYQELYDFSVRLPKLFWSYVWQFGSFVQSQEHNCVLQDDHKIPGGKWFAGASLNFAQNVMKYRDHSSAIVSYNEHGKQQHLSYGQLFNRVARLSHWFKQQGIQPGDKIVAVMPNVAETIVSMLAATSLGAVWSSCAADADVQEIMTRFEPLAAKILITTDGYFHGGSSHSNLAKINQLLPRLKTLERLVVVPYVEPALNAQVLAEQLTGAHAISTHLFADSLDNNAEDIDFAPLPFAHPLYILHDAATPHPQPGIVHSVGGTLLQHYKELVLHTDVKADDVLFYHTHCGDMMWHWMVSTLMTGATLVIYDGAPFYPQADALWQLAEQEKVSIFGGSSDYLHRLEALHCQPNKTLPLDALRTILCNGSALRPNGFDFVYRDIKQDVCLSAMVSEPTLISSLALGCSILPVYQGEVQCLGLGMAVHVYDRQGESVQPAEGVRGKLACRAPCPSMAIGFYRGEESEQNLSRYYLAQFSAHPIKTEGDESITSNRDFKHRQKNRQYLSLVLHHSLLDSHNNLAHR